MPNVLTGTKNNKPSHNQPRDVFVSLTIPQCLLGHMCYRNFQFSMRVYFSTLKMLFKWVALLLKEAELLDEKADSISGARNMQNLPGMASY